MRPSLFLRISAAFLLCAGLGASACGEEEATVRPRLNGTGDGDGGVEGGLGCGVAIPTTYDAPGFAANAALELALGASLNTLDQKMAETEGTSVTTVTGADLAALYNAGTPSLRTVSNSTSQGIIDAYLIDFGNAQGKTWQPSDAQADGGATSGGKFKSLFYESRVGVDIRAASTKAILGGALYTQALSVVAAGLTDAGVDKLVALFGATPAFANSTDVGAGASGDRFVAALASKRDDKAQPTGIYRRVRTALLTMKATVANPACKADQDAAVAAYLLGWEQATYASAIYALNQAVSTADKPDSAPVTLHAYGEALGLIQSFKGIPADKRRIQDAQIDIVLGKLHPETAYGLVTEPGLRSSDLTSAISDIALYEQFDANAVAAFKQSF